MNLLGCQDYRGIACILLASSGLSALLALLWDFGYWISISLYLASLAAPIYIADKLRSLVWIILSMLALSVFLYDEEFWSVTSLISLAGSLVLASSDVRASLISLGAPIALSVHFSPLDYKWNLLAVYALLLGLTSVMITGRLHSMIVAIAAIAPVLSPSYFSLAAVIVELLIVVAVSDIVRISGCPFKTDSRLLYAGAVLGSLTTIALLINNALYIQALWITSYLILLSAILSPRT